MNNLFGDDVTQIAEDTWNLDERHLGNLTQLMANDLEIQRDQIIDFELTCYDAQPSCLVGL